MTQRFDLYPTTCELRDDRWVFHIDSSDEPCNVSVRHRLYGDFYDWPDSVFDMKVKAALRAYDIADNEVTFRTRSAALAAAKDFLRQWGAGEVEYLEFDRDSQSMIVVNHEPRNWAFQFKPKWYADRTDPLAEFCEVVK